MGQVMDEGVETYFYRSIVSSRRHHKLVSAYLVERHHDSNVIARITPMGLVNAKLVEQEITLRGLRLHLVPTGRWQPTSTSHHARVRVARVTGGLADVTVSR